MTDDVTLPATGAIVATDEISTRHFQKVKLVHGANGVATDVTITAGAGLPVQVSNTAVGTAAGATDAGAPALSRRDDVLSTLSDPDGDYVTDRVDERGAKWVQLAGVMSALLGDSIHAMRNPGIDSFVHKSARYTTTQTGTAIWTPGSGNILVVTQLRLTWSGAEDGLIVIWADASSISDTAYTAGTDRFLFDNTVTPSTKGPGGVIIPCEFVAPTGTTQIPLRVTTTNNVDCTVMVDGYEDVP